MAEEFICDRCEFSVRSENEEELISEVQDHVMEEHGVQVSRQEVREALEEV